MPPSTRQPFILPYNPRQRCCMSVNEAWIVWWLCQNVKRCMVSKVVLRKEAVFWLVEFIVGILWFQSLLLCSRSNWSCSLWTGIWYEQCTAVSSAVNLCPIYFIHDSPTTVSRYSMPAINRFALHILCGLVCSTTSFNIRMKQIQ